MYGLVMYFYRYLNHENSLSSFLLVSFSASVHSFPSILFFLLEMLMRYAQLGLAVSFFKDVNHTLYNTQEYTMPKYT